MKAPHHSEPDLNEGPSAEKLEPGTIVRLKTGGPAMTVTLQVGELVRCTWVDLSGPRTFELRAADLQVERLPGKRQGA